MPESNASLVSLLSAGRLPVRRGSAEPVQGPPDVLNRLVDSYLVAVGGKAILLWLILRHAASAQANDLAERLSGCGLTPEELSDALDRLTAYRLCAIVPGVNGSDPELVVIHEPLDEQDFEAAFAGDGVNAPTSPAAAGIAHGEADEAPPEQLRPLIKGPELERVFARFHDRIGILGPQQFMALREWVEERGLAAEVVEAAIERVATTGKRTFNYLEGVLRNLYNSGVRTLSDLDDNSGSGLGARGLQPKDPAQSTSASLPNAAAYQKVSKDLIRRWKETHPDEYPS